MTPEIKVTYHKSGNIESKISYVNGERNGLDRRWDEYDGRKRWRVMRRHGKKHGRYIDWYADGQERQEAMWRDGGRHGVETMRYENGRKEWESYLLNEKEYARIKWDDEGNVIETKFHLRSSPANHAVKSKKITTTRE